MKQWFIRAWEEVRSSYWFLPALMALAAGVLSVVFIELDRHFRYEWVQSTGWIWSGGPEGARGLLSTVAGSMITVVSLTFSITIVAFAQASSQFGPRLLRSLMKDTANQFVLGTFTATYIYCLLILRTVRAGEGAEFTPHFSVTFAIFLALVSLGVLIYFIHHVALAIQAPYLVANVARDLLESIDQQFPQPKQNDQAEQVDQDLFRQALEQHLPQAQPVFSPGSGYVQNVDNERLVELAGKQKAIFFLPHRAGRFVSAGSSLVLAWPAERLTDDDHPQIARAFHLGTVRTYTQDVEFAIEQLVEVAVRALSPGVNDPFTAVNCIDWLGTALRKLAGRVLVKNFVVRDQAGEVRLIYMQPSTFAGAVEAAFNQIRQNARADVAVRIRLLETIASVMECVQVSDDRDSLLLQARMVTDGAQEAVLEDKDRKDIAAWFEKVAALHAQMADDGQAT